MDEELSNYPQIQLAVTLVVSHLFLAIWLWINWENISAAETFLVWLAAVGFCLLIYGLALGMRHLGKQVKRRAE